ncbi:hypothetical protein [Bacillus cytotoxicus]|uniref:hypothetical protein n=1 Tax=Bacillus cytotoxicus TaxID=580165 RepID=UPI001AEF11FF|nr:hypothetical protein [Bacillus cytotoxicus]QTR78463.1 hypothetical protein JC773_18570 [Bacillus cytotoxicus]
MIFNEIWQADMNENGLIPLIKGVSDDEKSEERGYVIVNLNPFPEGSETNSRDRQVNVLEEVYIPESKSPSYELLEKLHDNYKWRHNANDTTPQQEIDEVNEFLNFVITKQPMRIARDVAIEKEKITPDASDEEWINFLKFMWFHQYEGNSTSVFEHVFIGEQGGRLAERHRIPGRREYKLGGHHSWYHYYKNDGPYEITEEEDVIFFLKHVEVNRSEISDKAEVITVQYEYNAKDDQGSMVLFKETGGFFVGLSAEGLLAMGTVGFLDGRENFPIRINNETYDLTVWRTTDEHRYPRTFFPRIR